MNGTAARVYQVRAAIPGGRRDVSPTAAEDNRTNVSNVAGRTLRSASGSGSRSTAGIASSARPSKPGVRHRAATALASPTGRSPRTVERQVTRHRLDLPVGDNIAPAVRARRRRRQPHVDREARQTARAPPRPRLPPLGMRRRKMSADQPLVAHDAVPATRSAAAPTALLSQRAQTPPSPADKSPSSTALLQHRLMHAPRPAAAF